MNCLSRWWKEFNRGKDRKDEVWAPVEEPWPGLNTNEATELWYPRAATSTKMKTRGKFQQSHPLGCVIHYHAGRSKNPQTVLNDMRKRGICAFVIDREGHVWQDFPLDEWGWHAGPSFWKGLGAGLNRKTVGIEVFGAGKLEYKKAQFFSWFGKAFPRKEVILSEKRGNIKAGYYHAFTEIQIKELVDLILWLDSNGKGIFNLDYVLGHDEVAPTRKSDPGAALHSNKVPLTMVEFRLMLKDIKKAESH